MQVPGLSKRSVLVEPETLKILGTVSRDAILRFLRIHALDSSFTPEEQKEVSRERVWKKWMMDDK